MFKYEIDNNDDIFQIKYDSKFFIDLNNDNSKNYVIAEKFGKFFKYRIYENKCNFSLIKSITLLNKLLEDKNYNKLSNFIEKLGDILFFSDNDNENIVAISKFLKNLFLLYLYFLNYPYFYGVLTDEEINEILSSFKPDTNPYILEDKIRSGFEYLSYIVEVITVKINKSISLSNLKENFKFLQNLLIETKFLFEKIIFKGTMLKK